MANRTYDILKWVALVAMPALATLYATLGTIWGWPYQVQTMGTIAAVETALGTMLGVSSVRYNNDTEEDPHG